MCRSANDRLGYAQRKPHRTTETYRPLAGSLTKMAAPANNRKQFPVSRAAAPRMDSARHALAPVYYYASRDVTATPPPSRRPPRKRRRARAHDSPRTNVSLPLSPAGETALVRICPPQTYQTRARQSGRVTPAAPPLSGRFSRKLSPRERGTRTERRKFLIGRFRKIARATSACSFSCSLYRQIVKDNSSIKKISSFLSINALYGTRGEVNFYYALFNATKFTWIEQ